MNRDEVISLYGNIKDAGGELSWPEALKHGELIDIPDDISIHWLNCGHPTRRIWCNKALGPLILASLSNVKDRGLLNELLTFDGCWNMRLMRGASQRLSAHSWALAIDINAKENPLGGPSSMSDDFVKCWTDTGLIWGGTFKRCDPMHFTLCF